MQLDSRGQLGDAARDRARGRPGLQDLPRLREAADRLSDTLTAEDEAGRPTTRLFALYLLVAAGALALPFRPAYWPLLLALHLLPLLFAWPGAPLRRGLDAWSASMPRFSRVLRDWYPVLLIPALYAELAVLNRAAHGGHYFDAIIQGWEQALFNGQPSRDLAAALPLPWLSELLHFGYLSYYLIIYVPPVLLYLAGETRAFRQAVFALMLTFFLHYLFFIYFPVQGPRYLFPAPGGELADGALYQLTHRLLEAGSSQGAAFPSSHVGVAVAQTLTMLHFRRTLVPWLAALTLLLAVGAVYGGFHYAIDALCGLVLGTLAVVVAPAAYRVLGGTWNAARRHA